MQSIIRDESFRTISKDDLHKLILVEIEAKTGIIVPKDSIKICKWNTRRYNGYGLMLNLALEHNLIICETFNAYNVIDLLNNIMASALNADNVEITLKEVDYYELHFK